METLLYIDSVILHTYVITCMHAYRRRRTHSCMRGKRDALRRAHQHARGSPLQPFDVGCLGHATCMPVRGRVTMAVSAMHICSRVVKSKHVCTATCMHVHNCIRNNHGLWYATNNTRLVLALSDIVRTPACVMRQTMAPGTFPGTPRTQTTSVKHLYVHPEQRVH